MDTYIRTYIRTYIHTHTYIHIHTYVYARNMFTPVEASLGGWIATVAPNFISNMITVGIRLCEPVGGGWW